MGQNEKKKYNIWLLSDNNLVNGDNIDTENWNCLKCNNFSFLSVISPRSEGIINIK